MIKPIQIILAAADKTKAGFASVKTSLASLAKSAGSFNTLLSNIGVGVSFIGIIGAFKRATDAMDDAYKSAQKIGTSVENFSALSYAAGQAGVPVDELEKSLLKLSRTLDEAKTGTGSAFEAFTRLKIDPKQFDDPADALLVIAERFAQLPDGVSKATIAQQLFGRSGANLIPLLNAGADGIRELTDEAKELGRVFDTEAAKSAEQFNDNLDKLKTAGEAVVINTLNPMLPALVEVTNLMAEAAKQGGILSAIWAGFKSQTFDFLGNRDLSATYRLMRAEEQLASLRADGFKEDQRRVKQLREWIPLLQKSAELEKQAQEARVGRDKAVVDDFAENRKEEQEAFKKSTNEQISDAKRLEDALRSAFSASLSAERDYLRQAKKLRDEAAGGTVGTSVEDQASANLDAIAAQMKLQRIAASESLETVQDEAEAARTLAGQLEDVAIQKDLLRAANLAEATALERAAAEENARYTELARQQQAAAESADTMAAALEGIGKEVSVQIKLGTETDKSLEKLERFKYLIDHIASLGPRANAAAAAAATTNQSAGLSSLQSEALKYGRR